jgi:hypothetical protein
LGDILGNNIVRTLNQTKPNENMTAIAYSTENKTFCITSPEIAKAMLFMGNPHGFNRATEFPSSSVNQMREVMELNGFQIIA